MDKPKYKRILLKLSGEALSSGGEVIDPAILERYAREIRKVKDLGVEIAIVIGGGNIFRGAAAAKVGIDRVQGDYMGMLATVINGMAIQASLTGHLVFSTLHTNDAPGSVTRLIDMGVQPFLVASSVMAVMAQRLARVACPKCREPITPDPTELANFSITAEQASEATFMRGRGCNHCQHTGYRGRVAVFELMTMNSKIREMTFNREPAQNIRRQARLMGMKSLAEDAVDKALKGITTLLEVARLQKAVD